MARCPGVSLVWEISRGEISQSVISIAAAPDLPVFRKIRNIHETASRGDE